MKTSNTIIEAVGLTKEFKDFWQRPKAKAVNDIDFTVNEGEILGFLGPNGSGKSTTVKMLLGLLYPTSGNLSIFNTSPRSVDIKTRIGYLPEETYLYKYLNAFETLDFFGTLFNLSASERKARANQLLDMVGMSHVKNRPVGEFSKGMSRRIGLAQAMINDPDLLILDEPTSGLDPIGCREVKDLLKTLKSRGKTVFVTSHLLSDIEDICDRVIIMYGGQIRAEGTLNDLLVIPEKSKVTTPLLSPQETEKVLQLLRENLSDIEYKVEHPHKSLEEFFLEVVNSAKQSDIETSGVVSGGEIADYLKNDKANDILEQLTNKKTKTSLSEENKIEPPVLQDSVKVNEALNNLIEEEEVAGIDEDISIKNETESNNEFDNANKKLKDLGLASK